ncbi:penicillin-binding protein 1A [Ichthyobacterium seriolicida]|uniref:Penicillin-binding protein 1A n=1 Tax=Ichthyobacterium seriolicida TaxID=242600 RepID=A0A1J1E0V0_9FLAO|nr:penicillin-binding protein 1A [Ichthyobacterium seriolicida]
MASEIISSNGEVIGVFYEENRTPVKYTDISNHLVDALIATEDIRFFSHSGIDFRSLARAALKLGYSGGASTITQQLAKMLFTKSPSTDFFERLKQKVKEWIIAVRLERQYTKQEIITMYFNKFDFLYQAVGIKSAAKIYFDSTPDSLKIEEAAVLVGMAKNPFLYNPKKFPENSLKRRNVVIDQMYKNENISRRERDSLIQIPLNIKFSVEDHNIGIATYFREYLRLHLNQWIKEYAKESGKKYNLYRDGLKIYVTLDSRMQRYMEEAMKEHLSNLQEIFFKTHKDNITAPFLEITQEEEETIMRNSIKVTGRYKELVKNGVDQSKIDEIFNKKTKMTLFSWKGDIDTLMSPLDSIRYYKHFLQAGIMSMEPNTGHIKVWVGGINHKHFKYDHVKKGKRQVGSSFKPFVYATAINQLHLSPCYKLPNTRVLFKKEDWDIAEDWYPKNAGDKYGGMISLKEGLARSLNVITARLMKMIGPRPVVALAKKMGITSDIPQQPSISLGTPDLSVYEMIGALSVFANKGMYIEPKYILRIEDRYGSVLLNRENTGIVREVMSEEDSFATLKLMTGVTQYGTGVRLRTSHMSYPFDSSTGYPYAFVNEIAGKTGTTNNHSDGWFTGIVPNLATCVWVGNEDRSAHFEDLTFGQGATTALPIWALFMRKCYNDSTLNVSMDNFESPENMKINVDCKDGVYNDKKNDTEF